MVRLGAMGDIIHTLPAVTALRAAFPNARIGWIVEERWAELLCSGGTARSGPRTASRPLVDLVHTVDTKAWRKSLLSRETQRQISAALGEVRNSKYEIAIDFQGALKSAAIARCSKAGAIVGFGFSARSSGAPVIQAPRHDDEDARRRAICCSRRSRRRKKSNDPVSRISAR